MSVLQCWELGSYLAFGWHVGAVNMKTSGRNFGTMTSMMMMMMTAASAEVALSKEDPVA